MLSDACRAVAIARHFTLSKLQRLFPSLVCNASFHRASLLCFGLLFVRKRLGGAALVAALVKRLLAGDPDRQQRAAIVMNRVYGARGVHVVVRRMRAGMSRMLHTHPICSFGARLQVEASIWLGCAWL